jgi:hypothetical protein
MEAHRLKPMQPGYDQKLFNDIYQNTRALRRKLTSQIDPKRFGMDYQEVLSWFDVKFIHTFNRYYGTMNDDLLKGHIIKALQFFKNRILRYAYTQKNQVNNNCIDIDELHEHQDLAVEYEYKEDNKTLVKIALEFMQDNLSSEAYQVLVTELNPPTYILKRLDEKASTAKIPSTLIGEYLGLDQSKLNSLKKEIKTTVTQANVYFSQSEVI